MLNMLPAIASIASSVIGSRGSSGGGGGSNPNVLAAGERGLEGIELLFQNLLGTNLDFSKQAAIDDTQALVASIFDRFSKTALPEIYQGQVGSGGYNATTAQLLANDAFAGANTQAASAVLDTIKSYRGIQQSDFNALASLVGSITGSNPENPDTTGKYKFLGQMAKDGIGSLEKIYKARQDTLGDFIKGLPNS